MTDMVFAQLAVFAVAGVVAPFVWWATRLPPQPRLDEGLDHQLRALREERRREALRAANEVLR